MLNELSSTRLKPFCSSPIVFYTNGSRDRSRFSRWLHWSWSRPAAWVTCGSHAEAAATASGRRSGSCHRDLWPADMMIRSAAARLRGVKIRHRRPWPRTDQVALDIKRRWQERGTWLARVGVSSFASRYSLSIRGLPCRPWLESHHALERPQCTQFKNKSWADGQNRNQVKQRSRISKNPQVGVFPVATSVLLISCFKSHEREKGFFNVQHSCHFNTFVIPWLFVVYVISMADVMLHVCRMEGTHSQRR